jgi:hypothetical protein
MFCGGLFVHAIGVGSNHVVREAPVTLAKEKSWRRHTIAIMLLAGPAMVRTYQRRCDVTPRRRQDQGRQHIQINSQEVSVPINLCTTSRENNRIYLDIYKPHEVRLPTNQESSQLEVPTSGYGRITEGCTFWNFLNSMQERKQNGHNSLIWAPIKMNEYPLER